MRIIAGEARGRSLVAPRGMDTRPTLDRVRESLFNILRPYVAEARVLDLFAGSGALGLEAVSRGAAEAVFADSARAAQEAVQRNMETLRAGEKTRLLRCDWRAALRMLEGEGARFDLIFLDPPYKMPQAEAVLPALKESGLLAADALVVYEHARDLQPDTEGWAVVDRRDYRETVITFLTLPAEGDNDAHSALSGQL